MQTFLPYSNFVESARVLDRLRLGKQRAETLQILNACLYGSGWSNHPAVRMWKGHEGTLCAYGVCICAEWKRRGYWDTVLERLVYFEGLGSEMPSWLGVEEFHASHRAALLAKDPKWYGQFGWIEEPAIDYWWPTKEMER